VNLSRYQVELCAYGLRQLIDLVPLTPSRVRPELRGLLRQLDDMLLVTCDHASGSDSCAEELMLNDPINVAQVAEILACSRQWVRQIAKDLGGRWTGSNWVFDRHVILDHARERRKR
jgi:hypothetical protein